MITIKESLNIDPISKPRFEFRSFGKDFSEIVQRMEQLSLSGPEHRRVRISEEIYIISKINDLNNIKIRNDSLDVKTLVSYKQGLEQWRPLMKSAFPITGKILEEIVFSALQVSELIWGRDEYELGEFLNLIKSNPELQSVMVKKKRLRYLINETICEMAQVVIDDVPVTSISIESINVPDVLLTIKDLELEHVENINYLQAIKRIIGWINKPLAN
ncbi:MAG: hypothetical protein ACE5EE_01460 [Fidelibacterota bacterium]